MRDFYIDNNKSLINTPRTERSFLDYLPVAVTLTVPLLLGGCTNAITGLDHFNPTIVCETSSNPNKICGLSDGKTSYFQVNGQGRCGTIGVKYGDGDQQTMPGNFANVNGTLILSHDYTQQNPTGPRAWPGPKIVHAYSVANCTGEAKLRINVLLEGADLSGNIRFSPTYNLRLLQPGATACTAAPNMRPLRAGSTVHISSLSGTRINFGCAGDDCTYDMNGTSTATPSHFPFPDKRKHSLVFRIVAAGGQTQTEQGAPQSSFVVNQDGPLEYCVNDTILSDNSGAWGIGVLVDETAIP